MISFSKQLGLGIDNLDLFLKQNQRVNLMRVDASGILSSFFPLCEVHQKLFFFGNTISDQRKAEVLHATAAKTNVSQLTVKITKYFHHTTTMPIRCT